MFSRFAFLALLSVVLTPLASLVAQDEGPILSGKVEGNSYVSPTGAFRVQIPVLAELGGKIEDNENVVTFQDDFSIYMSVACFPLDAALRLEDEMSGRQNFLTSFYKKHIDADFKRRYPQMSVDNAVFLPKLEDGSLLTCILLPGGSMFNGRIFLSDGDPLPLAKRGNLVFVKNDYVFILSAELAEKVLERSSFKKTPKEENDMLRSHLTELLTKISFTMPIKPKKAATETKPAITK